MGVRGVLERERLLQWQEEKREGVYFPLLFNGCQDHIAHLSCSEFEKCLVSRTSSWGKQAQMDGKRHISSTALCHIVARIRSNLFYRPFRAFVYASEKKRPRFDRYSETRYASINLLSLQYLQVEKYVLLFFLRFRCFLTDLDLKYIKVSNKSVSSIEK